MQASLIMHEIAEVKIFSKKNFSGRKNFSWGNSMYDNVRKVGVNMYVYKSHIISSHFKVEVV